MNLDWFHLTLLDWILAGTFLLVFLIQLYHYLYYFSGVSRKNQQINNGLVNFETEKKPVSIVICARDQAENLAQNLPAILEQDYPEFQVIVVNDASTDGTQDLLADMELKYPHLYHTYLPAGIQSVSSRKIAMTLGIKAAKYDVLLLTEANCLPESNQWISGMMRNFDEKCDIVLGYSSYKYVKGPLRHLVTYDTLFTALQFMGFAAAGHPYRGFDRNLAYRKELFFKNRGYASHLNLKSGEEDLFVSEIANKSNTRIEIAPQSKILANTPDIWNHWKDKKRNRLVNSAFYSLGTKFRTGTEMCSRILFYAGFIALLVVGLIHLKVVVLVFACLLFIVRYALQLSVLNKSARCFGEHTFYLSIPLFDLYLPLLNLWLRLGLIFHKGNSYTWQVLK